MPGPWHRAKDDLLILLRASAVPYGWCCVLGDGIMADANQLYSLKLEDPSKQKTSLKFRLLLALSQALTCLQYELHSKYCLG